MSLKPSQINVAVTDALYARAKALERKTGIKPTEMGRVGLVEILNRLEGGLPLMLTAEPKVLRALGEVYALNIDPLPHLEAIIADAAQAAAQPAAAQP